eukprot:CAMPEP_0168559772 /NCGR_PEP_ID=MMETSP0413-20121227/10705_1 /TAXON_ID=136452 /ORGANISM="Filamoeba nolandi, Strain NC-AS-23-1" /LENGTH=520 /DNA_ID=CAMNT_0008591029 /DNA_START=219 /DNA_END=1777 /DNA_ORIENTATION=+
MKDPYGSYVVQQLVNTIPRIQKYYEQPGTNQQELAILEGLVISLSKDLLKVGDKKHIFLVELMKDKFATHVVRSLVCVLEGQILVEDKKLLKEKIIEPSESFHATFREILVGLQKDGALSELIYDKFSSPVVQLILDLSTKQDSTEFIKCCVGDSNNFTTAIKDSIACHFVDKIFEKCSEDLYSDLYTKYFRHKLLELSHHKQANWSVQHLIANANHGAQVQMFFEELQDNFAELIRASRAGIILKLVEAAAKHKTCQKDIYKALIKVFSNNLHEEKSKKKSESTAETKPSLTWFVFMNSNPTDASPVSAVGCLIFQAVLHFETNIIKPLLQSLDELSFSILRKLAYDQSGSRVVEALMTSTAIDTKVKNKLIHAFEGKYVELSMNKFGAFCMEKMYRTTDIKTKKLIAEELAAAEQQMMANLYGKIVMVNCRILDYISKRQLWETNEKQRETKRKAFAELLDDTSQQTDSQPKPKKHKPKQRDEIDELFDGVVDNNDKTRGHSQDEKKSIQTKGNQNST